MDFPVFDYKQISQYGVDDNDLDKIYQKYGSVYFSEEFPNRNE